MMFFKYAFLVLVLALSCLATGGFVSALLPQDEVDALNLITRKMGASGWNFSRDACENNLQIIPAKPMDPERNISCNCDFPNNTCHIVSLKIKRYSLAGELPPEMIQLPFLNNIDFSYNLLTGSIPREWASLPLNFIGLLANRLSGNLPSYLENFSNLTQLDLELNQFSGTIPQELGQLVNLKILKLSCNKFSGSLPMELAELKNLTDFRINDNNFNGSIPDFIQNWRQLGRLEMQASGLKGPIPASISVLEKLTDLRISNINVTNEAFPDLRNLTILTRLFLRSCNISGEIPSYIWRIGGLRIVDLTFNKLQGVLPTAITTETNRLVFVFLTGNLLSGTIPFFSSGLNIDLSYNNFSRRQDPSACQRTDIRLNLFRSSSVGNDIGGACENSFSCDRLRYALYINCGGENLEVNNKIYVGDANVGNGASNFYSSNDGWGLSSTGDFMDDNNFQNEAYIAQSPSSQNINELYRTARIAPLSLTYYHRCLINGNYTVSLHFAEIQFTNNSTYDSLGRRIFDIYIQNDEMEKDFNIADEAKGIGRQITKVYNATVTDNTLEIRFAWAGKGTTRIPLSGVYGPLVSAISVDPQFKPPSEGGNSKIAAIVGGVVGSFLILLALGFILWRRRVREKNERQKEFEGLEIQTISFTLKQIKAATKNFAPENKLGEGGFGPVYKGILADNTVIAVKQLSAKSSQGNREFLNEIGMISCIQHPNLVKLHGCCIEGNQLLLVYEYMENNSLARALIGPEQDQLYLNWQTRQKICVGIARGLAFLHEESLLKIVHRDIKATNVLLDKHLNPKISDFGLAKLDSEEKTHISTRVAGTIGYMAPEYALWGYLTYKADVYSFGILALEIASGKHNMSHGPENNFACLLDWACHLQQNKNLKELVDERLGSEFNKKEAERMIKVALLCTNGSPSLRPIMSEVVSMLEGTITIPDVVPEASSYKEDLRFKGIREHHNEIRSQNSKGSQNHNTTSSIRSSREYSLSASEQDLYEINPDSYASSQSKRDRNGQMDSQRSSGKQAIREFAKLFGELYQSHTVGP
ncbi:probable LRR receptor-like serine/threonine-protein kinase RFK1 [Mercurialis annua]|uniref:probable LRR receptor-like serine/threonine-protein kinase RFK1 n=1 Tax=Mercurialis annua TaxID=3986 RepID=UPI0021600E20|nr:probable LRR receptor-like serine/threonine-protein kinase RFK1 [Mercurialis annua]